MQDRWDYMRRSVIINEIIFVESEEYYHLWRDKGMLQSIDFSRYYMMITGLHKQICSSRLGADTFEYGGQFWLTEQECKKLLKKQGIKHISTMLLYDHSKRFCMVFSTPPNVSAKDVAEIVSSCFNRLYAQNFEMSKTPYHNYTVLSDEIHGYDNLHRTFEEIDELSRQQFFDMREMIMTPALLEASRREADREQLHEDLMLMFAAMRSGDGQESQQRYRAVMAQLCAARDFRLLKDALSAIHTTLGGILRSRGVEAAPQDREAFLVSSYPTFALLERGVGEKLLFYRRQISDMSPMSELIQEAVRYIRHHCAEDIAVADIAAHIGMSESWLTKRFKQECGKNIVAYLLDVRVQKAKALLVETDKLIQEIACAVGFENPGYFISVFRRVVGVTPKAYRQQMKEEKA